MLCRKAAQLYKEAGRNSAAAEALSKAAKLIEDTNPQVFGNAHELHACNVADILLPRLLLVKSSMLGLILSV